MNYEMIALLTVLAIPLAAGLALIVDAARRAFREVWEANHDLHA